MDNKSEFLIPVADYYSRKLVEHGDTHCGVDWNSEGSQRLRFQQLSNIIGRRGGFSVNDLGCGYGALWDYLSERWQDFSYSGWDVSKEMISAATQRHAQKNNARFLVAAEPLEATDYGIASGIFNVRLGRSDAEWVAHMDATLDALNRTSRLGFGFNCLTLYSDAEKRQDYLYYADPCALFDRCKKRYSRHVALLHDYGLYEFTILVRKGP